MRYAHAHCDYTENYIPSHTYTFTGLCVFTGKPYSVTVPAKGVHAYNNGTSLAAAFPGVSREDREFLISGISPEGWKAAFGTSEE